VSLSDAVSDSFNTLQETARTKGLTLSSDLPPGLPPAHADQTRVRQILIILLDNAIKFSPPGGAVHVQARLLEEDPHFLLLEVSDSGRGISPEVAERIFERLYQESEPIHASRKGLGLGLYICKELVTRQGGQIWVKRRTEQGSTLSFTLPAFSLNSVIGPLVETSNLDESITVALISEVVNRD
jgi:signal transduction histidine kinase